MDADIAEKVHKPSRFYLCVHSLQLLRPVWINKGSVVFFYLPSKYSKKVNETEQNILSFISLLRR